MSDIAEAVGKRIYAIRTSKHMSRKDLAKRSGLHLTYIGQLERGERNATIATLESVSYALMYRLSVLLNILHLEWLHRRLLQMNAIT